MSNNSNRNRNRRRRNFDRGDRSGGNETVPRPSGRTQPGFFQKILGLFGIGKSKPVSRPPNPSAASRQQAQAQRQGGESRPPREPKPRREQTPVNPAEITTERLYVGNLSYDATESDLFELFNGVGSVRNAEVVVNSRTQRSKGFAFVTMASLEEARRAVAELSGKDFMGRPLQLSGAKPNTRGDDAGGRDSQPQEEAAPAAA
ncbi:MAG: hypothetical protein HS117_13690 [Verrucomicrobiaceae bacterium]|jgi:RNA recognition motif-containing protein|nr:hypothetical protein [Verrucomicrobiaceae bacterium]